MKIRARQKRNIKRDYVVTLSKLDQSIDKIIVTAYNRAEAERIAMTKTYRLGYRLMHIRKR